MSQKNVETIRALIPPPEIDVATLIRDDSLFEQAAAALADTIDPDIESEATWQGDSRTTYVGTAGFRQLWLDWLEPWATYHTHVEELIDAGDHVVALIRDRAQRPDSDAEIELIAASVWTFTNRKIVRVGFYAHRDEALRVAGLAS